MLTPSIVELSAVIAQHTKTIDDYLTENNLPPLSFHKDSSADFPDAPPKIMAVRAALIDATKTLHDLIVGPTHSITWVAFCVKTASAQILSRGY